VTDGSDAWGLILAGGCDHVGLHCGCRWIGLAGIGRSIMMMVVGVSWREAKFLLIFPWGSDTFEVGLSIL